MGLQDYQDEVRNEEMHRKAEWKSTRGGSDEYTMTPAEFEKYSMFMGQAVAVGFTNEQAEFLFTLTKGI